MFSIGDGLLTSGSDAEGLSVDNAVMDYLSKKVVIDQSEKLALARLSGKLGLSSEELEKSIRSLGTRNFVRKIYLHGKVGFELTPKGESALRALTKAKAALVTRRLQEAIHQDRQAKLRFNMVNKLISVEDEWQNSEFPEKELMEKVERQIEHFSLDTKNIEAEQPFCDSCDGNYDEEFSRYRPRVDELVQQSINLSRTVNRYLKVKNYNVMILTDIGRFERAIRKYEPIVEASDQVSRLKTSVDRLRLIQAKLEGFDSEMLSRFEQLKIKLGSTFRLLEVLRRPTHEFMSVKREPSTEKTKLYQDPEYPIKYSNNASGSQFVEKCRRCGAERDATPVTIG
jgi:predicted transcriptional regulator